LSTSLTFKDLGLSSSMMNAIEKRGFVAPSPVQQEVIPILLTTKSHIVAQAQTGTGKTAAFGIPLLELLKEDSYTQAIILTPTRELCMQVSDELHSFKHGKLDILSVYGGQSIDIQLKKLKKKPQIIVGTPGRVIDHLKRRTLDISQISYLVLDEADEMLSMGFQEDIETILEYTQSCDPQILLFSATFPRAIKALIKKYIPQYEQVTIESKQQTTMLIDQIYYEVSFKDKFDALCRIIDITPDFYGIIFCQTKVDVQAVNQKLTESGYKSGEIHGNLSQSQREVTLRKFKSQAITILVATDVAARGIDIQNLTHVINFTIPNDPEVYVHRIGRTGRAGKNGIAISLVSRNEYPTLMIIKNKTHFSIEKRDLPNSEDMIKLKQVALEKELLKACAASSLEKNYKDLAQSLLKDGDPEQIVAGLLKYFTKDSLSHHAYKNFQDSSFSHKQEGDTRIFIAMGKKDGTTPESLIEFLLSKGDMKSRDIQKILILNEFSFATIPKIYAEILVKIEKNAATSKKKPLISIAKESQSFGSRRPFDGEKRMGNSRNKNYKVRSSRY
jgi:ATP-dependent RNA helicase DeaD